MFNALYITWFTWCVFSPFMSHLQSSACVSGVFIAAEASAVPTADCDRALSGRAGSQNEALGVSEKELNPRFLPA